MTFNGGVRDRLFISPVIVLYVNFRGNISTVPFINVRDNHIFAILIK